MLSRVADKCLLTKIVAIRKESWIFSNNVYFLYVYPILNEDTVRNDLFCLHTSPQTLSQWSDSIPQVVVVKILPRFRQDFLQWLQTCVRLRKHLLLKNSDKNPAGSSPTNLIAKDPCWDGQGKLIAHCGCCIRSVSCTYITYGFFSKELIWIGKKT